MIVRGVRAGDVGVQPLHLVGKAVFGQECQRAVDDGRLPRPALLRQLFQQVIGPQRLVLPQEQFQHLPTNLRQAQALGRAGLLRDGEGAVLAGGVVVPVESRDIHVSPRCEDSGCLRITLNLTTHETL